MVVGNPRRLHEWPYFLHCPPMGDLLIKFHIYNAQLQKWERLHYSSFVRASPNPNPLTRSHVTFVSPERREEEKISLVYYCRILATLSGYIFVCVTMGNIGGTGSLTSKDEIIGR